MRLSPFLIHISLPAAFVLIAAGGCSERDINGTDETERCPGYIIDYVSSQTNQTLRDVFFVSKSDGWAVGAEGVVVGTVDGGVTWQIQPTTGSRTLYGVHFVSADTGWAVGSGGTVLSTTNGGLAWAHASIGSAALTDIHALDARNAWVVGGSRILSTNDGGTTWSEHINSPISIPTLYRVEFIDRNHGWLVGTGKTILHTNDGGRNFVPQTTGTGNPLLGLDMVDANNGWAVGVGGMILHTPDGGRNWVAQKASTALVLHGVDFSDQNHGFVVGDSGKVFGTLDGGVLWEEIDSGTSNTLRQVFFVNDTTALACGEKGTMLRITRTLLDCPVY